MVFHLILIDSKTKQIWKTPKHNDNKKKDDFHSQVKPLIKAHLPDKLKKILGNNCDIEIRDGELYIVSQKFDEDTGRRNKISKRTELKPENYFDRVFKLVLYTILSELELSQYESISIQVHREKKETRTYDVEIILLDRD